MTTLYETQLAELQAFGQALTEPKEPGTQGSAAWFAARAGRATASRFHDIIARRKDGKGYLAGRETYMWEIAIERMIGGPVDHYTSTAMQWGIDNESAARMAYEGRTGAFCEVVGFIPHPTLTVTTEGEGGASPDALVGDDGGIEIKCPFNSANHLGCFLDGVPVEHTAQIQGAMWITGRKWWDFISFDPRLPAPFNLYVHRVERDQEFIAHMEEEIIKFLRETRQLENRLRLSAGVPLLPDDIQ